MKGIKCSGRCRMKMIRCTRLTTFVLSFALMICMLPQVQLTAGASSLSDAEARLAALESQYNTAKEQRKNAAGVYSDALASYNKSKSSYTQALDVKNALDKEISAMETEVEETYVLIDEYNAQIADFKVDIADKEQEIAKKYEGFKDRIRMNYEDSFVSYLELVFTSKSFSDLLSRVDIVGSMMDYDARVMDELDTAKKEMSDMQTQMETLQLQASQKLVTLEEQIPLLEEKKIENAKLLEDLQVLYNEAAAKYNAASGVKKDADSDVNALARQIAAAEAEVQAIIAAQQEKTKDEDYIGGALRWPVRGSISSGYGYRSDPFTGAQAFHNGIDIPCPYGTSICAAGSGRVTIASYHSSYGNYVVVDHGGGISTLYAHNSSLCVSVGQTVSAGSVIARAGATGSATGNHCHFCVFVNGSPVNPMGYLS